jgi:heptosyltransferase I
MPERICIVMMSAAGDVVHVLPVLNAIKRARPASHITWVLQPGPATLAQGHPAVDEIILFDRSRGWRAFLDARDALAPKRFDLVINLQVYFKAGIITAFANAPVKLGFDRARARDFNWLFTNRKIPPHPNQHVQDQYFEFLREIGIEPEPVTWNLGPWPDERPWQRDFFADVERPAVAMVVATSKPEKDWLPERWAELSDALHHDRVILERARHKPRSALGSGLRKLVSILDGSALAIAPDTGPLHMAVAIDRPVVSLMGYTNPKRTGPYRKFHDLIVDAYGDPGEDYPISMENRRGRMGRIGVRDVLDRVERWRSRYASSGP